MIIVNCRARFLVSCVAAAIGLSACSSAPSTTADPGAVSVPIAAPMHPDAVASIDVAGGKLIEFYDFAGSGVMVMESGKAEGASALHSRPDVQQMIGSGEFVHAFLALRPDLPVPASLQALQARVVQLDQRAPDDVEGTGGGRATGTVPPPPQTGSALPTPSSSTQSGGGGTGVQPQDCGNMCCDYAWLTGTMCNYSTNWFLYDYGWSYANTSSTDAIYADACAATGTSLWTVQVQDGSGGTCSIAQGYYRSYWWYTTGNYNWIHTWVNTEETQALHSYCGAWAL